MRTMVPLLLAAACTSGEVDGSELREAACSTEYLTVTHAADGSTTIDSEIRAELDSDVDRTELWRVSAIACELVESPPRPTCAPNQECGARPTSSCVNVFTGITVTGRLLATCGSRVERRNPNGVMLSSELRKYNTVTFRIQ